MHHKRGVQSWIEKMQNHFEKGRLVEKSLMKFEVLNLKLCLHETTPYSFLGSPCNASLLHHCNYQNPFYPCTQDYNYAL